ncbi:Nucleoside-diphosphate-sugar epimerase [Mameliella alba]|uniref:SDR family oxidoreductase n=1 Tax=Mameliella alba TaxID=561184 RepID=UPI000889D626|nr:SDR family oxidoreductase [Mameliella alba]OWV49122.1 NAD(P)-dependent oxidoreductase [Mameliella alba]PTR40891.1 nucleoside-diphosphate-sugar epimerase [Mameliella alba]GGF47084.1 NAD(P)-dependent oxidoreductase [Mameliella alba]SDC61007.1 Nucleoside-diphosphate-sugar epimerase [Mameliella alba]
MTKTLLSLGHGFSARALAPLLLSEGWEVIGTTRDPAKLEAMRATGVTPILWQEDSVTKALGRATHLLMSAAPDAEGDPALRLVGPAIAASAPRIEWAGYLSTTGVYGDHQGGWVTEDTPLDPATRRGQLRVEAEAAWAAVPGLPLHIFRLAGIYGPGRGPFAKLRKGTARRIIKPNQVFSRIHVEDIAQVLRASIARPNPGAAYNLCDDAPAPPQDVIACAAEMLGMPIPPEVPFEEAELSPMARSFYGESKRVCNARIKEELGVTLRYPDYQSALAAILAAEQASGG